MKNDYVEIRCSCSVTLLKNEMFLRIRSKLKMQKNTFFYFYQFSCLLLCEPRARLWGLILGGRMSVCLAGQARPCPGQSFVKHLSSELIEKPKGEPMHWNLSINSLIFYFVNDLLFALCFSVSNRHAHTHTHTHTKKNTRTQTLCLAYLYLK